MSQLVAPVNTLRNEYVVFTGKLHDMVRRDAFRAVRAKRGKANENVNDMTTILVRGTSPFWQYRDYGLKEELVADKIMSGLDIAVIDADSFLNLVRHNKPAQQAKTIAGIPMSELVSIHDEALYAEDEPVPRGSVDEWTGVKNRPEQAQLRTIHLKGKASAKCCICGNKFPASLLRPSHLKRRSECSSQEKRDQSNIAMLMCETGCNAMYERGFISINNEGKVVITKNGQTTVDLRRKLKELRGRKCRNYSVEQEPYLDWHRRTVFLG